jgi:hypothetical protein
VYYVFKGIGSQLGMDVTDEELRKLGAETESERSLRRSDELRAYTEGFDRENLQS